ncbi:hypothetical protein C0995_012576, partial [Termitomyces sp. Mi166
GKGKIVLMLSDKSDYGESLSEHEQELEEGESAAQHFQHVQYNKKLAAKKANKAKAEAALQHRAINDFSGRIPNGLGVKVWGPLDVEWLNSCFTGALSNCVYYSVHNNAIFIRADANWDLQSPIRSDKDKDFVIPQHILTCLTHVKEDGMTVLHDMHTPDPSQPFDLKQIAQYALIFGRPGLENTWQGIAFDFAYRMHWQTLFGFALCWALCATSAAKPAVVRWLALVMVRPRMYLEAVASYNAAFPDQPMVAQYRSHLNLLQVHVPDEMAQNFLDNDALHI